MRSLGESCPNILVNQAQNTLHCIIYFPALACNITESKRSLPYCKLQQFRQATQIPIIVGQKQDKDVQMQEVDNELR